MMDNEESEILNSNDGSLKHLIKVCTIFCASVGGPRVIPREDQSKKAVKPF